MSEHDDNLKPLAIEGQLPLKAVGIENLKEANPGQMPPHRYLHPWFARRPTPASRLAILGSVLPDGVDVDQLLKWMKIGPSNIEGEISKYVEDKKRTEGERDGTISDHYGYPRPYTASPSSQEREQLKKTVKENWGGELPTVLDPTAGGGVIPFESYRYGLPTAANELNAIPWLMLNLMLDHLPSVGTVESAVSKWAEEIDESAEKNLEQYFPSEEPRQTPSHYAATYTVECVECGTDIPLVKRWWLDKDSSSKGVAARPQLNDSGGVQYSCVTLPDDVRKSEFDPNDGPKSRSGAECLSCGVILEDEIVKERLRSGEFEHEIFGVKYVKDAGGSAWRAPNEQDEKAMKSAEQRIENDFELSTLLNVERYIGDEDRAGPYGVTQWRDAFSPRQLVTHFEYLSAFEEHKDAIKEAYDDDVSKTILTILSLASSKLIDRNNRFAPLDRTRGNPGDALGGKHFTLQWTYVDNNLSAGIQSYQTAYTRVKNSYEELASYVDDVEASQPTVLNGDAAHLDLDSESVQAVVMDPPYYDSIIYSELSDICYVWLNEYLGDIYPDVFSQSLSDKSKEAVANVAEFEDVAGEGQSKSELAERDYESKMSAIFSELFRVLEPGGVMTVMFTHKESSAWDTLTMALIDAGFTVTSTHPITSEMPQRTDTKGGGSADSTLLLTGRKPIKEDEEEKIPTLWSDVEAETRKAAKESARDLLNSGVSLTKTDVIISAFGPTLRIFAENHPVVDDRDREVRPRKALETAREAVTQILVDEYLEGMDVDNLDDITEWYILCWLVHEAETFSYDDGRQLGLGIGVDIDEIKRSTKTWRKSRGDISLRGHDGRVQNINEKPEDRSSRLPIDPDDLSFPRSLDAVHAAMHVYDKRGETETIEWLRERNFDSDSQFKATLKALLQVLPHNHEDWELARDLAVGRTSDVLDLDFSPNVFAEDNDDTTQSTLGEH